MSSSRVWLRQPRVWCCSGGTWVEYEEACGLGRKMLRKFEAVRESDGKKVRGRAGIPDTHFTIPAVSGNQRGYLYRQDGTLMFHAYTKEAK